MALPPTMRAVVFKGVGEVAVEDRPVPEIKAPKDAVLRVTSSALCGSDLVGCLPITAPLKLTCV